MRILKEADFIACEDTRESMKLLKHFGVHTPLLAFHKFSTRKETEAIASRIEKGENCALITDAGTPCISDPGSSLVALAGDLGNVAVYELSTGKMVQSWNDHYLVRALGGVKFDASGDLIMVSDFSSTQFTIYSVSNGLALYTMHADGAVTAWGFDEATGDGVLVYEDGSAQAADIFTSPEELYAYAGAGL